MMEKMTFEVALKKLEALVKELESGELDLEVAVKKYQEGIDLAKFCHDLLKNAENVVVKMMKDDNLVDFPKLDE